MPKSTRSIQELKSELQAQEKKLAALESKRATLLNRLAAVDRLIGAIAGAPARGAKAAAPVVGVKAVRRRRGGGKGGKPLIDYIAGVLAKAPQGMRAKDVAKGVIQAGYRTTSKDFYQIVASTLRDKRFKRIKRGVYKLA